MSIKKLLSLRKFSNVQLVSSMNSLVGSWIFLLVHMIWFIIWLVMRWDIGILTMIVSLEAIILMIILLMAQNRQNIKDDLRDEADLQADLQSVDLGDKILKEVKAIKRDIEDLKK